MIATATPIETPELESLGAPLDPPPLESAGALASVGDCAALPSAVAVASVSAEVRSVKSPPDSTVTGAMSTRDIDRARLIATAAATETPPSEVSAFGVFAAPPSPLPPLPLEVWSANPR